jgi:hypothetical protein
MAITYSISGGADAAKFSIDGSTGKLTFKTAPDFENPGDANKDNVYEVQVKATDAGGAASTKDMRVTVTDVSENAPPQITSAGAVSVAENSTTVMTVTATDPDDGGSTPPPDPQTAWPDSTNTGVPAGTTLTPSGGMTISTAGTTVSGKDISGTVTISASNVTLRNCKVRSGSYWVIQITGGTGVVVDHCTIDGMGTGGQQGSVGINGGDGATFTANNIFNVEDGIHPRSGCTMRDNYIHDLAAPGSPHYDGIQIDNNISNVTVTHNSVINGHNQTSAVMIDNWNGPTSNVTVDNNLLCGGGYTIYCDGTQSSQPITNVRITNNHMGAGGFGITNFNGTNPVYTGNVNDGHELAATLK